MEDAVKTTEPPLCMAPDPNPRTPDFIPPANACDAHCHIFGPAAEYPFAPDRSYTPPDAGLAQFKALKKILGLDRAVLVNASCHGTDNTVILDAIAQSDGQYRGVANVDDRFSDDDFQKLNDGGVRGCRFNFVRHLGGVADMDEFHSIVERVRPLGWHVVLHFDAEDLLKFMAMLLKLPVPFIIDHMGRVPTVNGLAQQPFKNLLEVAKLENCWIKVCGAERIASEGPPFTSAVPFAQAVIDVAPDRTLWGTDWPHPNIKKHMPNDGDLVDLIPLIAPTKEGQQKLLVDNPDRLYGFGT
ncbi:MAG: amidohydrolase family protein [Proteobacteria bacterium]|nr:amidohydrolase family protein [Pseudomonadota bacterium]